MKKKNQSSQDHTPFEGLSDSERESFAPLLSQLSDMPNTMPPIDEQRIAQMRSKLEAHAQPNPAFKLYRLRPALAMAASFIGLLVIAAFWLFRTETVQAPQNAPQHIQLADGSTIDLNAGSQIRYQPNLMRWKRAIHLQGEAFFDVAKAQQSGPPFTVTTDLAEVTVLGTQFNVNHKPTQRQTTVYLFEGRVSLKTPA